MRSRSGKKFGALWSAVTGFSIIACGANPALPASGWSITPLRESWKVSGFEENRDLSGIASVNGKSVLLGSDELISAQTGVLDRGTHSITAGELIPLLSNPSGKKLEVDIEGVAADSKGSCYYVTGSHGTGKKNGEYQEARATVFQIPWDPATGQPNIAGIRRASLMPWVLQSPQFQEYAKKPLQLNGFNIEGLAFRDGRLYFGVRGPNIQGKTFLIETTPESLFGGKLPECRVFELDVGNGRGIRGMAAVRGGLILITGNASAEATKKFPVSQARGGDKTFDVLLWRAEQEPTLSAIGAIPFPSGKAESALVLEETEKYVDLLVLFDGADDGGARSFRLTQP